MNDRGPIAIAMSGGVDSSVAAARLVHQGANVFGLMLTLWSSPSGENRCCSPRALDDARRVAALLGIPFYVLDAQAPFKERVVDAFLAGYANGLTPNPCLACNQHIRWGFLLQHALAMGATHLATGHYARVRSEAAQRLLLRSADRVKDQSYVLSVLDQAQLSKAVFPLGNLTKPQVRALAREYALPVAEREESQDLCFLAGSDYRAFLREHLGAPSQSGPILDTRDQVLGMHPGLSDYTIGQRKGIGLASSTPLYVIEKRPASNALVVGPREQLGRREFRTDTIHWIRGEEPSGPVRARTRVRYRAAEVDATIHSSGAEGGRVVLDQPLPDVTPGQWAAFYDGEVCLGGGTIRA